HTLFISITLCPLCSPLFPYTTLFRSIRAAAQHDDIELVHRGGVAREKVLLHARFRAGGGKNGDVARGVQTIDRGEVHVRVALERSEEHTSELQSQSNLVCRLLLEKKN